MAGDIYISPLPGMASDIYISPLPGMAGDIYIYNSSTWNGW